MKTKKDYAKMIDSAIKLVNVKETRIRAIEKGLESYAKQHAIDVMRKALEAGRILPNENSEWGSLENLYKITINSPK